LIKHFEESSKTTEQVVFLLNFRVVNINWNCIVILDWNHVINITGILKINSDIKKQSKSKSYRKVKALHSAKEL